MKIKIKNIFQTKFQSRDKIDDKEVSSLAASIKTGGLLHPITVRETPDGIDDKSEQQYELIAGSRRIAAHQLLGLDEIEAHVKNIDDKTAAILAAAENIERKNYKPLEEALAIDKALKDSSIDEVAVAFGRSSGQISRIHRLMQLSDNWKKAVESGFAKEWPISALIEVARAPAEIQKSLFGNYKDGWNGDPTVEKIRNAIFGEGHFLKTAAFEIDECLKCQKSTCAAPMLFDDVTTAKKGDRCMDKICWQKKTMETIEAKVAKFKEENPAGVIVEADQIPYNHPIQKQAIHQWEYAKAKKTDKGTVAALNLQTGKIEAVKLTGQASENMKKRDADGKISMKERRTRLEKRRVIRYLEKIVAVIEDMVKHKHEYPYATTVPLVAIFGAEPLPGKSKMYQNPLDVKFNDDHGPKEIFQCLAPKMIKALADEMRSATPQKRRGDVFKDGLGIRTEEIYTEACEEIPEPKSWAAEPDEMKTTKKETKKASDEMPAAKERTCRICGTHTRGDDGHH